MKRMVACAVFVAALAVAGTASAKSDYHIGPFTSTSPDNGSCGQQWAVDTFTRDYNVHANGDGTYRVREEFKNGSFTTTGPVSPGACETGSNHGSVVTAGITGTMQGFLEGTVTSSTFDPNGCNVSGADCTTTQGFLQAVFGASGPATFTCNFGYAGCDFNFEYAAGGQGLLYHHWQDTEVQGAEVFRGDIATG